MSETSPSSLDQQPKANTDSRADTIAILVVILTVLCAVVYWVSHQV